MAAIRVVIVDDHSDVRASTRALLAEDLDLAVVGEAGSGREALRQARALRPDVVLLDLDLPDDCGINVARELRLTVPGTRVVVLTEYDDDAYVAAARGAGVAAYLLKTARGSEVIRALRETGQHQANVPTA